MVKKNVTTVNSGKMVVDKKMQTDERIEVVSDLNAEEGDDIMRKAAGIVEPTRYIKDDPAQAEVAPESWLK